MDFSYNLVMFHFPLHFSWQIGQKNWRFFFSLFLSSTFKDPNEALVIKESWVVLKLFAMFVAVANSAVILCGGFKVIHAWWEN